MLAFGFVGSTGTQILLNLNLSAFSPEISLQDLVFCLLKKPLFVFAMQIEVQQRD